MYYNRQVKYLDYLEHRSKIRSAGFVKIEVKDQNCNILVNINGLYPTDSYQREVWISDGRQEKVLGKIALQQGKGIMTLRGTLVYNLAGTEIGYNQLAEIRIKLGKERELYCIWKEQIAKQNKLEQSLKEQLKQQQGFLAAGRSITLEAADNLKEKQRREKEEQRKETEEQGKEREKQRKIEIREAEQERVEQAKLEQRELGQEIEQRKTKQKELELGKIEQIKLEQAKEIETEEIKGIEVEKGKEIRIGKIKEIDIEKIKEIEIGEGKVEEIKAQEEQEIETKEIEIKTRETDRREIEQKRIEQEEIRQRKEAEVKQIERKKIEAEQTKSEQTKERFRGNIRPYFYEDKWKQLSYIYPHITPFHDEREYLSISPSDFVILQSKYHKLVNNSFLLHGYYNYEHLILARIRKREGEAYYIGVPGNFYEREKQVALMFGFESFECKKEPAQIGDYGYYMIRIEL